MVNNSDSEASRSLLDDGNVTGCLEEGLSDNHDFQTLLKRRPKQVLHWLQEDGAEKLGDFEVEDHLFYGAKPSEVGLLTEGHTSKHIDYERFWMSKLQSSSTSKKPSEWTEKVRVEAWVLALKNAAAPADVGLLQPLLERYSTGATTMMVFGLPAVLAVVDFKWEHWSRRMLWVELMLFLIWLFSFNVFTILYQDEDPTMSLGEVAATHVGQATIALGIVAQIGMLPFIYIEIATIVEYGKTWFNPQNMIDGLTYVAQIAITVMYFGRLHLNSDTILVLMAAQSILLWLRLQFYLKVFRASKYAFVDTLHVIMRDVKWFLVFLILTMWGFACAFHVLYRNDQEETQEYSNAFRSLYTVFAAAVGDFDAETYLKHHNPKLAVGLFCIYLFIVTVILLNVLIALLTNAQEKMTENAGIRAVMSKAQIIDELEDSLPGWLKRRAGNHWYPMYIHILKLGQGQKEQLKPDSLWAGAEELLDSNEEVRIRMRALEARLDLMQGSVDELISALPPEARQRASGNTQRLRNEARQDDEAADQVVERREE